MPGKDSRPSAGGPARRGWKKGGRGGKKAREAAPPPPPPADEADFKVDDRVAARIDDAFYPAKVTGVFQRAVGRQYRLVLFPPDGFRDPPGLRQRWYQGTAEHLRPLADHLPKLEAPLIPVEFSILSSLTFFTRFPWSSEKASLAFEGKKFRCTPADYHITSICKAAGDVLEATKAAAWGLSPKEKSFRPYPAAPNRNALDIMADYIRTCNDRLAVFEIAFSSGFAESGPICLDGSAPILLPDGRTTVSARDIRAGDLVLVRCEATGTRRAAAVTATWTQLVGRRMGMCDLGAALLTPDHPVRGPDGTWTRPDALVDPEAVHVDALHMFGVEGFAPVVLACEGGREVVACTLGMNVRGFEDPIWGTERVMDLMGGIGGFRDAVSMLAVA